MSDNIQSKYFYPVAPETAKEYAKLIFKPVKQGECVTTIWVPMAGRRTVTHFLIENRHFFTESIPQKEDKHFLIYIEPLDLTEENLLGYLRLMGLSLIETCQKECPEIDIDTNSFQELFNKEEVKYSELLGSLKLLIEKIVRLGYKITFFLGEFDELSFVNSIFCNNLKSLWFRYQQKLSLVFLIRENVTNPEVTARYGELNEALLQNVIFIPLKRNEISYLIERNEFLLRCKFSAKKKEIIEKVCGPHPFLIKAACRIATAQNGDKISEKELEDFLLHHFQLQSATQKILDLRTEGEREILSEIVKGNQILSETRELMDLEKLGLVFKVEKNSWLPFSLLFAKIVSQSKKRALTVSESEGGFELDKKTATLILDGRPVEEKFTRQEYELVVNFLKNPNKLYNRGEIGEILWGKDSYDKYSDWAIDQIMSKVRKKFKNLGIKNSLITIRGRGYKFI